MLNVVRSPGEGFPVVLSVAVGGDGGDSDAMETIGNGLRNYGSPSKMHH